MSIALILIFKAFFTPNFSDGAGLACRLDFVPLGDLSRGVDGFAVAAFSFSGGRGLFTLGDRVPDAGRFALACCSCSCISISFFFFHAFNDVGCT